MLRYIGPVYVAPMEEGGLREFSVKPVEGWKKQVIDLDKVRCWLKTEADGGKTSSDAFVSARRRSKTVSFPDYWTHL